MKRVKKSNFTELVGMIQREAAQRFQPSVPLIKKVIDILLEKNFIERDPESRETYIYVAWVFCVTISIVKIPVKPKQFCIY